MEAAGGWPAEDRAEPRRARSRSPAREREIRDSRDAPRDDRERSSYSARDDRPAPSSYRGPRNQPPAEKNNVIGVFGLSLQTQERDLEEEFGRSGRVEKVTIVYDQRSQRSRGFGFIVMREIEDATRAIADMNGQELHGRRIRVDYSTTSRPHNPTPGQYMGYVPAGGEPPARDDRRPPRDDYDSRSRRSDPYESRGSRYDDRDRGRDREYDDRRRRSPSPRRRRSPSPVRRDDRDRY